jgi:hypothetical protein
MTLSRLLVDANPREHDECPETDNEMPSSEDWLGVLAKYRTAVLAISDVEPPAPVA